MVKIGAIICFVHPLPVKLGLSGGVYNVFSWLQLFLGHSPSVEVFPPNDTLSNNGDIVGPFPLLLYGVVIIIRYSLVYSIADVLWYH